MNINDAFPSNYIKANDLRGQAVLVQISDVVYEDIGSDRKPVMYFAGKDKGLVLNKTNSLMVASKHGPETDGWIGAQVELYPDKTQFQGQMVDCLRVRIPIPPAAPPAPALQPPADSAPAPSWDHLNTNVKGAGTPF